MCGVRTGVRGTGLARRWTDAGRRKPFHLRHLAALAGRTRSTVAQPLNYPGPSRDRRQDVIAHRSNECASGTRPGGTHMTLFISRIRQIVREESGQDLIEYAMLVALIALGCVVAVTAAGTKVTDVFNAIVAAIPS